MEEQTPKKKRGCLWTVLIVVAVLYFIGKSSSDVAQKGAELDTQAPTTAATQAATAAPTELPGSAAEAVANGTLTMKEIRDRAEALGWSTTAWQEWYYVASQTGTTMEAIEEAAKNINRQLAEEDPDFLAALETIGITEAQAKAMTPEKLFDAVITGLQNYNS